MKGQDIVSLSNIKCYIGVTVSQFPLRIWSLVLLQVHVLAVLFYLFVKN